MTRSSRSPQPLRQVWHWLRTEHGLTARLALATLLGIGAAASATGLLLTAAWLIARAAQHPPVLYLMVAIVAVRAFGIARGVLRYAERLVAHDAAFRLLTAVRVAVYRRVERLGPTALADTRRGDLVRRLVGDVDAVQDLLLRALLPPVVTAALAGGVTLLVVAILPAAGLGLAVAVLGVLIFVPLLVRATGRAAERSIAPAHGRLAAEVSDSVLSASDLVVYGAAGAAVDRFNEVAESLRAAERRSAWGSGLAQAIVLLFVGAAVCLAAALGVAAVARSALDPVLLPLIVLAPLGLHEVLAAIPEGAPGVSRGGPGDRAARATNPSRRAGAAGGAAQAADGGRCTRPDHRMEARPTGAAQPPPRPFGWGTVRCGRGQWQREEHVGGGAVAIRAGPSGAVVRRRAGRHRAFD